MAYNRRPHRVTQRATLSLMTGREVRDELPRKVGQAGIDDEGWKDRDQEERLKNKLCADNRRHARPCDIKVGDSVLLSQELCARKASAEL